MSSWKFTSESVSEGHPDKVADQISDAILDALLTEEEPEELGGLRVACETLVTTGLALISGEIRTTTYVDIARIARDTITEIGYNGGENGFDGQTCAVMVCIDPQSEDIAQGVDGDEQGAGDQGMMFGYACGETSELMPAPISLAHRLAERHAEIRRKATIPYLGPDAKTQVTFEYEGNRPVRLCSVLVSTQHREGISRNRMIRPDLVEQVIDPVLAEHFPQFADDDFDLLVNPTGSFVKGGPVADTGLTGRKIIVDTYGGMARHGGGAFSGKDPSKVDRSAAYAARWVAKHIVASGAASRCELQVAYAIGQADPTSLMVDTFGTETVDANKIEAAVRDIFDLRPAAIIRDLDLLRPIYKKTAAYGHFGRAPQEGRFTWEQLNRLKDLKSALGL